MVRKRHKPLSFSVLVFGYGFVYSLAVLDTSAFPVPTATTFLSLSPLAQQHYYQHQQHSKKHRNHGLLQLPAPAAASSNEGTGPINKDAFLAAYKLLQESRGTRTSSSSSQQQPAGFDDYMIGKLQVELNLVPEPGLDLCEAAGITLVSSVSGNAAKVGIAVGDTIVSVKGGNMQVSVKELPLEDTGSYLMQAAQNAAQNGSAIIDLALNRLIKIKFLDEPPQLPPAKDGGDDERSMATYSVES